MRYEEFKAKAVHAVGQLMGDDGCIERIERYGENECYIYVLEGGYEPARMKAWLAKDGSVCLGYR